MVELFSSTTQRYDVNVKCERLGTFQRAGVTIMMSGADMSRYESHRAMLRDKLRLASLELTVGEIAALFPHLLQSDAGSYFVTNRMRTMRIVSPNSEKRTWVVHFVNPEHRAFGESLGKIDLTEDEFQRYDEVAENYKSLTGHRSMPLMVIAATLAHVDGVNANWASANFFPGTLAVLIQKVK